MELTVDNCKFLCVGEKKFQLYLYYEQLWCVCFYIEIGSWLYKKNKQINKINYPSVWVKIANQVLRII